MSKTARTVITDFLQAAIDGTLPVNPYKPAGNKLPPVNNKDILCLYNMNMEVQVFVSPNGAEAVEGRRNTWAKDGQTFWHIRVPKDANSEPYWEDKPLDWALSHHALAVGMTGWDWANRRSRWVAFDFDAITGHAPGVGVTDEKLQQVREAATSIPWVQTRKSTRGGGIHLYVFMDDAGVPTENHTIHQALGRCILAKMSQEAGFNFASAIDACGGNMWVWHRDANQKNEGLSIVHDATTTISQTDLPTNWRDHVDVVTRKRTKIKIRGIPDSEDESFDTMASSRNIISLDEGHKETIQKLSEECGATTIWVPEYNLLQTHTCAFAQLREQFPQDYIGFFETNSSGNNVAEPNCFAFPLPHGGWKVYRFGRGHKEHASWVQDGREYTSTYFNCRPDLETASLSMGAAEVDHGFQFETLRHAMKAALALGADLKDVEEWADEGRETELQKVKATGRLKVKVEKRPNDRKPGFGWVEKRNHWEKIFKVECDPREMKNAEYPVFDNMYRALVTPGGEHAGWAVWDTCQEGWDMQPAGNVKMMLQKAAYTKNEAEQIMGGLLEKRWRLVNMPFKPEFPGNRQWNYQSPQYRYAPAVLKDNETPQHPHWDKILDHVGRELDEVLHEDIWANKHGINTGRQYMQLWIASMLREPFEPLPYLFLHGPQNSGKSILHESIGKLITTGICRADKPLTTTGEHNGELANAVLAVVEETNLNGRGGERALNRMKDWVTAEYITIRRMRTDSYLQRNTLKFIQCSNDREHCLIMPGDTRITMLWVGSLGYGEEIPKGVLKKALEAEAPHFMNTLLGLEIPVAEGRLRIPVVSTRDKEHMESLNMNSLLRFISENCFELDGATVPYSTFYKRFQTYLPEEEKAYWTHRHVSQKFPRQFPKGKYGGTGDIFIGNMAWDASAATDGEALVLCEKRLRPKSEATRRNKGNDQ
jgi:hypothetical protein